MSALTFYNRYLFAHSPTYASWVRLTARDVHSSLVRGPGFEGQDVWFYGNHPVRWVRLVGIVVAFDDLETRTVISLDDGSGHQIDLIAWKTPQPGADPGSFIPADLTGVSLHSIVKAKGTINVYWGRKQLLLKRISVIWDTNDEVVAWEETLKFKREVLDVPWVVDNATIKEEKRKLAGGEEKEEERRRRERREKRRETKLAEEKGEKKRERGEENMLWESLAEKQVQGEWRQAGEKRAGSDAGSEPKRRKTEAVMETAYRGRRRPPGVKPAPPPPPEEPPEETQTTATTFRGRRRTTPAPKIASTPVPIPIPIPEPEPELPAPPENSSTYRGHRRALKAGGLRLEPKLEPEPEPSLPPDGTYRGRRRAEKRQTEQKARDVLPDPEPEPEPELPLPPEGTYRGHRRATRPKPDFKATDIIPDPVSSVPQAPKPPSEPEPTPPLDTSTFRGHRRTQKQTPAAPPPSDPPAPAARRRPTKPPTSTPLPLLPSGLTYRETWKLMKKQNEQLALSQSSSTLPYQSSTLKEDEESSVYKRQKKAEETQTLGSIYRGKRRAMVETSLPSQVSTYVPTPTEGGKLRGGGGVDVEKVGMEVIGETEVISTYEPTPETSFCGKRRREKSFAPPPEEYSQVYGTLSTYAPTPTPEVMSTYEPTPGRRKRGEEEEYSQVYSISTYAPTPTPGISSTISTYNPTPGTSFRGHRRRGDTPSASAPPPPPPSSAAEVESSQLYSTISTYEPSPPLAVAVSFRGRRRGAEMTTPVPEFSSQVFGTASTYVPTQDETVPPMSTYEPTPPPPPMSISTYQLTPPAPSSGNPSQVSAYVPTPSPRGRRRGVGKVESPLASPAGLPPSGNPSQLVGGSIYRGKRRG